MKKNRLLAKWLNDTLSEKEWAEWKAHPDFEKYEKIKAYSAHLVVDDLEENAMLSQILQQPKASPKVFKLSANWIFRAAAVLVLALGITFAVQNFVPQKQLANFGKKTTFSLPDHSEVVLNSGSEISYKRWRWSMHRHLELQGEAYFKVAKGSRFEVQTDLGKVTVLGTQFNVKARKNRFDIICYEGRVQVNYGDAQVILTHGQSVSFENGKRFDTTVAALQPEWIDNQLAFDQENIRNVLDEIERQYDVAIELQAKSASSLFTGVLPSNDLTTALHIISTTYHLEAVVVSKSKIIFEER